MKRRLRGQREKGKKGRNALEGLLTALVDLLEEWPYWIRVKVRSISERLEFDDVLRLGGGEEGVRKRGGWVRRREKGCFCGTLVSHRSESGISAKSVGGRTEESRLGK